MTLLFIVESPMYANNFIVKLYIIMQLDRPIPNNFFKAYNTICS